jgi:predicted SprT family Zn-dependent metalloprotease
LIKTQGVFSKKNSTSTKLSFVESLSTILDNEDQRDPTVLIYMKKFKNKAVKNELLQKCYNEINRVSFDNQLPADLKLVWSGRLSSTGGYCKNITRASTRSSEIHVSTKVCDSPERMRDTLAHEMCHAAAFLINGLLDGHGSVWKSWANRVNFTFKKIPKITVTHSYEIKKKFIFKCQTCKFEIHRFSKSIDVNKELCGLCHGRFEIILNNKNDKNKIEETLDNDDRFDRIKNDDYEFKSASSSAKVSSAIENAVTRTPNKFAMYVKENYNTIKKDKNLNSHKDVMQELSKNFKQLSAK